MDIYLLCSAQVGRPKFRKRGPPNTDVELGITGRTLTSSGTTWERWSHDGSDNGAPLNPVASSGWSSFSCPQGFHRPSPNSFSDQRSVGLQDANVPGTHTYVSSWLVVSIPLKNISQMGLLFPIYGKIKFMFQTTNQTRFITFPCTLLAALSVHKRQFLKSAQIPFSDRARDFALAHLAGLGPVKPPFLKCSLLEVLKQKQLIEMAMKWQDPEIKHGKLGNPQTKWRLTAGDIIIISYING